MASRSMLAESDRGGEGLLRIVRVCKDRAGTQKTHPRFQPDETDRGMPPRIARRPVAASGCFLCGVTPGRAFKFVRGRSDRSWWMASRQF